MPVQHEATVDHCGAELFRKHGVPQECSAGAFLFVRGSESRAVYLIERGLVKVAYEGDGNKEYISGFGATGTILGLSAALLGRPHANSAVTLQRSKVVLLRRVDLKRIIEEMPAMSECVCTLVAHENLEYANNLYGLSLLNAPARLIRFIRLAASETYGNLDHSSLVPSLPILRRDLAAAIAVTPTHLSRLLRTLENRGELTVRGDRIFVRPQRIQVAARE